MLADGQTFLCRLHMLMCEQTQHAQGFGSKDCDAGFHPNLNCVSYPKTKAEIKAQNDFSIKNKITIFYQTKKNETSDLKLVLQTQTNVCPF